MEICKGWVQINEEYPMLIVGLKVCILMLDCIYWWMYDVIIK